ncbi:MAG: WD40 repeat domain-containing protein [Anaerolineales bacterium]
MKKLHLIFLSILFFIPACTSKPSTVVPEPTASITPIQEPTQVNKKAILLDFAISPDGNNLAIYLNTGVYLYNVKTMKKAAFYRFESDEYYSKLNEVGTIYPPFGAPGTLAFSPDGSKIAISGKFQDEFISVWDLNAHEVVDYITNYPNGNYVRELEYSPDGSALLIRSTYPKSKLQCPEQGEPAEDTLSLISLSPRITFFEKKNCNRYSVVEFHFSENNLIYFFHFSDSSLYHIDKVNTQTGETIISEETSIGSDGRIYDVSPNGLVFASLDERTNIIDSVTRKRLLSLDGIINFLSDENHFLLAHQSQLQLQENKKVICVFSGLEYYQPYSKVSKDRKTIAVLAFNNRFFQNSIQIWDIPSCKLVNTISFDDITQ